MSDINLYRGAFHSREKGVVGGGGAGAGEAAAGKLLLLLPNRTKATGREKENIPLSLGGVRD